MGSGRQVKNRRQQAIALKARGQRPARFDAHTGEPGRRQTLEHDGGLFARRRIEHRIVPAAIGIGAHQRPALHDAHEKSGVQRARLLAAQAKLNGNARFAQIGDAGAGSVGMGIFRRDDNTAHAGVQQERRAQGSSTM